MQSATLGFLNYKFVLKLHWVTYTRRIIAHSTDKGSGMWGSYLEAKHPT